MNKVVAYLAFMTMATLFLLAACGSPVTAQNTTRSIRLNNYAMWDFLCDQTTDPQEMMQMLAKRDNVCYTEEWISVTPQALKSLNPNVKVYRLFDLMCKCSWDSDWRNGPSDLSHLQTPFTKDQIDKNNWWLRDAKGNIVKENATIWYLDVGKPGFKEAYLKAVLDRTANQGFDGIVFDYWWPSLAWLIPNYGGTMPPNGYSSDQEWFDKAWKPFVIYVCNGVHAAGYRIIGNCVGEYRDGNPRRMWQRTKVDGVVYEQLAFDFPPNVGGWLPATTIQRRMTAINTDPLEVWAVDGGLEDTDPAYNEKRKVSLAMYYISLPWPPDECSYHAHYSGKIYWEPLWDLDIGNPTQAAVKRTGSYFWSRKFKNGMVLLNYDPKQTITYFLSRPYRDSDGNLISNKAVLPPHSAMILTYPTLQQGAADGRIDLQHSTTTLGS